MSGFKERSPLPWRGGCIRLALSPAYASRLHPEEEVDPLSLFSLAEMAVEKKKR